MSCAAIQDRVKAYQGYLSPTLEALSPNDKMNRCLKIIRLPWVIGILFLYFFVLPINSLRRISPPITIALNKNIAFIMDYYFTHDTLPPELIPFLESSKTDDIAIHPATPPTTKPAENEEPEFVLSCPVWLGVGDWIWVAKPTPLLYFPENVEKESLPIMMFFNPQLDQQKVVIRNNTRIQCSEMPTPKAEQFLHEKGISPYQIQIQRPRWAGLLFNMIICCITILLFLPLGRISLRRRLGRVIIICGAMIPLLFMLFCLGYYPLFFMSCLGIAILFCGITEVFQPNS